jgi:hypothetical protein
MNISLSHEQPLYLSPGLLSLPQGNCVTFHTAGRYDTSRTRLLCFSGTGFNDKALATASTSRDVHLLDLSTLYGHA